MTQSLRRRALLACALVVLAAVLSLLPHFKDSAELVRMRNALLIDFTDTPRFDWTPADMPADFAAEKAAPTEQFVMRAQALHLERLPGDWERALAIGRHLLENRRNAATMGTAIQSDLEQTYAAIRGSGTGYCADFSDVFDAMALAAGLQVRTWAFSFEGFGGLGHVFNEVWDERHGRWLMLDVANNFFPVDEAGRPMSGLEYRERVRRGAGAPRVEAVEPLALTGFANAEAAAKYYRRGLHQWYMWWGNAVFTYDDALLVRALGPVSRSLEQLGGIAQGVFPRIRVLVEPENRAMVERMQGLRSHLLTALGVSVAASLAAAVLLAGYLREARRAKRRAMLSFRVRHRGR